MQCLRLGGRLFSGSLYGTAVELNAIPYSFPSPPQAVARALTRQGFPRVFAIAGGFSGWGGWADSKLAVTPAVSVRRGVPMLPSFGSMAGGTGGTTKALPAPATGGIRYLGGAPASGAAASSTAKTLATSGMLKKVGWMNIVNIFFVCFAIVKHGDRTCEVCMHAHGNGDCMLTEMGTCCTQN